MMNGMAKRNVFTVMVFALLSTVFAAGVFAQVTVSGGLALSSIDDIKVRGDGQSPRIKTESGIGGNFSVDYLLPVGVPMSLGFEIGVDTAEFTVKDAIAHYYEGYYTGTTDAKESIMVIPLLLRVAYHFDLVARLDLYIVGKIGYAIGYWSGDLYNLYKDADNVSIDDIGGVAFGFDIGAAFYMSPQFGLFAELGFDRYALETKIKSKNGSWSNTLEAPFSRFLTFGLSIKF